MSDKIEVHCECGKSFKVAASYAGRTGRCSECGRRMMITDTPAGREATDGEFELVDDRAEERARLEGEMASLREAIAVNPMDAQAHMSLAQLLSQCGDNVQALDHFRTAYLMDKSLKHALARIEAIAGPAERKRLEDGEEEDALSGDFWRELARAFVVPFAKKGIGMLVIGTLFFYGIGVWMSVSRYGGPFGFIGIVLMSVFVVCFLATYAFDAILNAIDGKLEPPDWPDFFNGGEMAWSGLALLFCIVMSFLPMLIVAGVQARAFWRYLFDRAPLAPGLWWIVVCFILGLFYLPMALLAVALLRSVWAALPIVVVPAIWRTHVRYFATALLVLAAFGMRTLAVRYVPWRIVGEFIGLYALLVEAHALGVLYRCNAERIGWFVKRGDAEDDE